MRWARAPHVIDSISRTINTDSLYKLHRAALTADNPLFAWREVECETLRLSGRYGSLAAAAASKRMLDTAFKPADRVAEDRLEYRLHNMTAAEQAAMSTGPRVCGDLGFRAGPREVDGIPIDDIVLRPVRPKRP
jgi:hypothetical protein